METSQYLDLFLEESNDHLQILNKNLLIMESNPTKIELLDEIFRAAHTLKGMSATMGFEKIAHLTHHMENVLGKLRDRVVPFTNKVCDILFKCVDFIEGMLKDIASGNQGDMDIDELVVSLNNIENSIEAAATVLVEAEDLTSASKNNIDFNDYDKNLIIKAQENNFNIYEIEVTVDENCVMKAVRAFMVFRNLEPLGEIIKSNPSVQDIEDENFELSFNLVFFSPHTIDEVREAINNVSEVKSFVTIPEYYFEKEEIYVEEKIISGNELEVKSEKIEKTVSNETIKKAKINQTVRVDIGKLDNLMNLVGELVINKTRLEQIFLTNNINSLNETIEQIDRITTDLQSVVMNVRMVPIEQVFNRFPRMVRDLSKDLNKEVNLVLEGKETELDRTVIDEIGDPLVHLIRNSIDHGLETVQDRRKSNKSDIGTLKLVARHEGNQVIIEVEDDGKGISPTKIKEKALEKGLINTADLEHLDENAIVNLIFLPGFSTAKEVTDISGRGVGLDAVKNKIQSLNGTVQIETREGIGSKFTVKLPLTLAIIQALLVKVQSETYAIPLGNIEETTSLNIDEIKNIQGQKVMVLRGKVLPLIYLQKNLQITQEKESNNDEIYVVVVRRGNQQLGLVVDELIGQQEIVIKSLGKILSGLRALAGAAILGDGQVSLILDVNTLF